MSCQNLLYGRILHGTFKVRLESGCMGGAFVDRGGLFGGEMHLELEKRVVEHLMCGILDGVSSFSTAHKHIIDYSMP